LDNEVNTNSSNSPSGNTSPTTGNRHQHAAAKRARITSADAARLEVVVAVLSSDAVKAKPGMIVLLQVWGGTESLRAKVKLIEPITFTKISALGIEEQRVNIIADPIDDLHNLGDGYRVGARIIIWSSDSVMKIPGSSVFRVGDKWHVFAIENNRARSRPVQIGWRNCNEVQIINRLDTGMQLFRCSGFLAISYVIEIE
jgi:HlyD family secretion protein